MASKQRISDVLGRMFDAVNKKDLDALDQAVDDAVAADFLEHGHEGGDHATTPNEIKQVWRGTFDSLPDLEVALEDLIVEEDRAAVRGIRRRTDPETGKRQRSWFIGFYRLAGDKMAEEWSAASPRQDEA